MGLIPTGRLQKVQFFQSKLDPFGTNAVAIGTTSSQVTALGTKVTDASDKLAAQEAAKAAYKLATQSADAAIAAMVSAGSDIIKEIRSKAANSANPQDIYDLAQIPAPATPTPVTDLGQPNTFSVGLGLDGSLTIKWKCASPRATGVIYQVWRKLQSESEFTYLAGTGAKEFTDATVPSGSSTTMYKIQAVRSTAFGPWGTFTVMFGVGAGGAMQASVSEGPGAPKMAA